VITAQATITPGELETAKDYLRRAFEIEFELARSGVGGQRLGAALGFPQPRLTGETLAGAGVS
jgi:hypothetical protein